MKRKKISGLLSLATLAIVSILTACPPPADSGGGSKGDSISGPSFQNLSIDVAKKKIIVFFNTDISGTPDASKISLKKGSATLTLTTDYTLAIESGRLVITLKVAPKENDKYTLELQGGAVKNAKGKDSTANTSSENKTLTVGIIPAIANPLAFQANSDTVLTLAFNTDIEIFDSKKIKVEVKADDAEGFTAARASSMVDTTTTTQLNLTLGTAATHGNVYRVKVGAGAIKATASNLANTAELSSSQTTYSTSLILNTDPYILNNKLVAPFNLSIEIRDQKKVKVYKTPTSVSDGDAVPLVSGNVAVNSTSKNLLEITLPEAVLAGEVYRLRLDAGAVSEEGETANANKAIAPADITIGAAPALGTAPYLAGQKIIVNFDGPIRILDPAGIKYRFKASSGAGFSVAVKPNNEPKVISDNQLEIPLNAPLEDGQVYRIDLEPGAITGKNTVSMGAIQPVDKDITAVLPTLTNVQPAVDSTTQLSITFPVAVAIVGDGSGINVHKKDEEGSFTTLTAASRTIVVDGMNSKKINIILTDRDETTLYKVWKVVLPKNTVQNATNGIPNSSSLETEESDETKLTDLYSWTLVTEESGSSKWKARSLHTSVVFKDKIWVLGGHDGKEILNDVWSSEDGEIWTESKPPNDRDGNKVSKDTEGIDANWWLARADHTSVVFKDKIWVLGGYTGKYLNDVWSSEDGETWTESKPPNDRDGNKVSKDTAGTAANWWTARDRHTSVVFKGKIWVMGGFDSTDSLNDVWNSPDGSVWKKESASADWDARRRHASAVFDNKIWVIGGQGSEDIQNSVWYSTNGQAWTRSEVDLTDNPHDNFRNHEIVKYNNRLWILGGQQYESFLSSASPTAGWTEETALSLRIRKTQAVVFKKSIWLLGGDYGGNQTGNVWKIGPASE